MASPSRSVFSLSCLLLVALGEVACDSGATEAAAWRAAEPVGGKADGATGLYGSDIPSEWVDPDARYVRVRDIALLEELGALVGPASQVARRADGIIDAAEADGQLHVEELVRLGESPYVDLLYPEEVDALADLWPLFTLADGPSVELAFGDLPMFEPVDRIEPLTLEPVDLWVLADFPAELQPSLTRGQLLHNADGDAATVHRADLEAAIDQPGPFTPAEVEDFAAGFVFLNAQGEASGRARVALPAPGVFEDLIEVGPLTFARVVETSYTETRWGDSRLTWEHAINVKGELEGERIVEGTIVRSDGQEVVVREQLGDGSLGPETHYTAEPGYLNGSMHVEVFEAGTRTFAGWVRSTPILDRPQTERFESRPVVVPLKETLEGDPIVLNVRHAERTTNAGLFRQTVEFSYDLEPRPPAQPWYAGMADDMKWTHIGLPMGRYRISTDNVDELFIEVYDHGAARAVLDEDRSAWLEPSNHERPNFATAWTGLRVGLHPGGHVELRSIGPHWGVEWVGLTAADRVE